LAIGLPLLVIILLIGFVLLGIEVGQMYFFFGVIIPYLALAIFLVGFVRRILKWAMAPVPFRIPLTGGQQKSLPWIKDSKLDSPSTTAGVVGRMALEVLLFRSLFRNTKTELHKGPKLTYRWEKWLWLGGLAFHWSFLIIILRHLRFFTEPVPGFVTFLSGMDGLFRFGFQAFLITDVLIVLALTYLFLRRILVPQFRYISLSADYFPLFLIGSIAISGILMKYLSRVDVKSVKELTLGLVTFQPVLPSDGVGVLFYIHFFLVSVLLAYFPFSKLVHLGGIFLSPTRNMANDNRARRHVNPWNYPVDVHTYEQYEDEFREKMIAAGLSVEKR
jgi:nitrate reductase gamma subunit